jgi:hypothetical protein
MAAEAPGPRLVSPVLGYVFDDGATAIRTVSGIPGAASFGDTVNLPTTLSEAYVHSGARIAVGITKEGRIALASWGSRESVTTLESPFIGLKLVSFSRSGGRVGLSDGVALEVWSTGEAPALLTRHIADSEITAIAVDDTGVALAATVSGTIVRFSNDAADIIAAGGEWSALTFASEGTDLIAADASFHELVRVTAEGGRRVLAALPGVAQAIATLGSEAYVAASPSWGLIVVSAPGVVTPIACDCQPKGLARMAGAVHILGTSLVLDAGEGEPRITTLPSLFAVSAEGAN